MPCVNLVVKHVPCNPAGMIVGPTGHENRCWVFVHTYPHDATVEYELYDKDEADVTANNVVRIGPPNQPSLPPYYNSVFRIDVPRDAEAFRLDLTATDSRGEYDPACHSLLLSCRRPRGGGKRGPAINILSPGEVGVQGPYFPEPATGFMVCGTVDDTTATMSATIALASLVQKGKAAGTAGVPVMPPPQPYDWAFCFGPVAPANYHIVVTATPQTGGPSQKDTYVSAS